MVVVPAGSYRMGSLGRWEHEGPVHDVTIAAPFAIGVYEVTVAEFGRFVGETGYSAGSSCWTYENGEWDSRAGRDWRNPGFGQSGRHPVTCTSWGDAQAYAAWLLQETGEEYRLPSESEWDYAARAGTLKARPWGEGESGQCRHTNGADASAKDRYSSWSGSVACRDGHVHTAPVGSFAANGWGLHDLLGNVWEWTEDCWNGSYAGAPSDGSVWEYGNCAVRVCRGGSWFSGPSDLRAAGRGGVTSGSRDVDRGFRVARTLAPMNPNLLTSGAWEALASIGFHAWHLVALGVTQRGSVGLKETPVGRTRPADRMLLVWATVGVRQSWQRALGGTSYRPAPGGPSTGSAFICPQICCMLAVALSLLTLVNRGTLRRVASALTQRTRCLTCASGYRCVRRCVTTVDLTTEWRK